MQSSNVNPNVNNNQLLLQDIKEVKDEFIKTIRFSQSLMIILNSGGLVSLVGFFTNRQDPPGLIMFAAIFFIVGVLFGMLTLLSDFFTGYFLFNNLLKVTHQKNLVNEYYSGKEKKNRFNSLQEVLIRLIALGLSSPIFWLLGIVCIFNYILNMKHSVLCVLFIFILIIIAGYFLYSWLKANLAWGSKQN